MVYANPFLIWTPTKAEGGNATRNLYDEAYYWGLQAGANTNRVDITRNLGTGHTLRIRRSCCLFLRVRLH